MDNAPSTTPMNMILKRMRNKTSEVHARLEARLKRLQRSISRCISSMAWRCWSASRRRARRRGGAESKDPVGFRKTFGQRRTLPSDPTGFFTAHRTAAKARADGPGRTADDLVRLLGDPFPPPGDPGLSPNDRVRFLGYPGRLPNDPGRRPDDPGIFAEYRGRLADDAPFSLINTHS